MISVVVLSRNDEDLIKGCLESVKWADEILVVVDEGPGKAIDIAKRYTNKIYSNKQEDFSARRNLGMEKASGDWVLYVDADERVLKELKEEIQEIVKSSGKSAYALSRKNIIFGKLVSYGPYQRDWMIRLFKKDRFKNWVGVVHEYGSFEGELGYTKNSLLHLTHRDLDQIVLKSLDWSNIDAKLRLDAAHPKMTSWRFLRIFITETFNQGIKRRGFFNGTIGVMDSMLQVFSLFMTYVRLWQMQQSEPLDEVYKKIDEKLIKDGFEY